MPLNFPYFQTGNAILDGNFWVSIQFPKSQDNWLFSEFLGALENMGYTSAWIEFGESTAEDAAQQFRYIMNNGIFDMAWDIGDIKFTTAPPRYATWLLCDATLYIGSDYPDLFARIGTTYNQPGDPSTSFRTPDMRGRVVAMTDNSSGRSPWATSPGATAGESAHTLTVSEIPSHTHSDLGHTHSEGTATPTVINGGLEAPAASAFPSVGITGIGNANIQSTGGDGAHNNVQPSMALACYILAEF